MITAGAIGTTTPARKPRAPSRARQRVIPTNPRYQIVFEKRLLLAGTISSLVSELRSLTERGGVLAGHVYALAAGSVLARVERLEDASADRAFRRRAQAAPSDPGTRRAVSPPITPTKLK